MEKDLAQSDLPVFTFSDTIGPLSLSHVCWAHIMTLAETVSYVTLLQFCNITAWQKPSNVGQGKIFYNLNLAGLLSLCKIATGLSFSISEDAAFL